MPDIIQQIRDAYAENPAKAMQLLPKLFEAADEGKIVELPFIAMVERTTIDGKFKQSAKLQAFNGRYGIVYSDKKKWGTPLIDICSDHAYDREAAETALKEREK